MITLILLLIPLFASLICFAVNKNGARSFALAASLLQLAVTVVALFMFKSDMAAQFPLNYTWVESLGISFHMAFDGISILLVLLTSFLLPLIILSSWTQNINNPKAFYGLILFMQFALTGVFAAMDGFLFYIFWELALIPIYFICLLWGGAERVRITLKFFIYTLSGSLLMLVGFIYLWMQTPDPHSFDIHALYNLSLTAEAQSWLFWAFFLAFAVKIPVFPFHTWQPDTYTDAPVQGTMLLSGIMLKMGLYGIIRWMLPIMPEGVEQWSDLAMILAITGVVYASCMALVQQDFKRLIAYSSIAHVGLITAGIFAFNIQGLQGAMVQMLAHGVNATGLFFVAEIVQRRMQTRNLKELGGIANNNRSFTILYMIILLGTVALPLTNGFVGEFLLLNAIYQYSTIMSAIAGLTIILAAVYLLRSYQAVMLGDENKRSALFTKLHVSEKIVLVVIAIVIIAAGIYPKPILNIAQPALEEVLAHVKAVY